VLGSGFLQPQSSLPFEGSSLQVDLYLLRIFRGGLLFLPPCHHCSVLVEMVVAEVLVVVLLVVVEEVVAFEWLVVRAAGDWLVGIVVEVLLGFPLP